LKRWRFTDQNVVQLEFMRADAIQQPSSNKAALFISDKRNNANRSFPKKSAGINICLDHSDNLIALLFVDLSCLAPIGYKNIDEGWTYPFGTHWQAQRYKVSVVEFCITVSNDLWGATKMFPKDDLFAKQVKGISQPILAL